MTLKSYCLAPLHSLPKLAALMGLSTGLVLGSSYQPAIAGEIIRASQDRCVAMGRVILSWDAGIKNGAWVCEQDVLRVGQKLRVDLLCLNQRYVARLRGGEHQVSNGCSPISHKPPRRCSSQSRLSCGRLRGNEATETSPSLHKPYGDILASTPQTLEWKTVAQSDTYRVYIEGEGRVWQFETQQPSLDLANQSITFEAEGTYLVTIAAITQTQILGKSTHAFNLLSHSQLDALQDSLKQVQAQSSSVSEQAQLISQLYWDEGIYDQAISQLEKLQDQYSQNAEVLMLLGDRYFEVGRYELAHQAYQTLLSLNINSDTQVAAQAAIERLSFIEQPS